MSEEKAVMTMEQIISKSYEVVSHNIDKYGEVVVDTTLRVYQVNAIQTIVTSLIGISICLLAIRYLIYSKWMKELRESDVDANDIGGFIITAIGITISMFFLIMYMFKLFDVFNIAAAMGSPELLILKNVLASQGLL